METEKEGIFLLHLSHAYKMMYHIHENIVSLQREAGVGGQASKQHLSLFPALSPVLPSLDDIVT